MIASRYTYASHFVDLRRPEQGLPRDHDRERCPGYIGVHDGREEYWIPNERFEKVAGGKPEATRLKEELELHGRIATQRRSARSPSWSSVSFPGSSACTSSR